MAAATDSTTVPARRLLRAAGPCRVLTTIHVPALVGGEDTVAVEEVGQPASLPGPARAARHTRVLRSVADRLLGVACAMLRTGASFDSNLTTKTAC